MWESLEKPITCWFESKSEGNIQLFDFLIYYIFIFGAYRLVFLFFHLPDIIELFQEQMIHGPSVFFTVMFL